mmetsp:Transcript_69541/g.127622  ORF Transcript_69541/g.127622 Transcript_69541/m.127622 type:complete len:106 (+) Transcript_69541:102-419(+)
MGDPDGESRNLIIIAVSCAAVLLCLSPFCMYFIRKHCRNPEEDAKERLRAAYHTQMASEEFSRRYAQAEQSPRPRGLLESIFAGPRCFSNCGRREPPPPVLRGQE